MGNAVKEPINIKYFIQQEAAAINAITSIKAATLSGSERIVTHSARRTIVRSAIQRVNERSPFCEAHYESDLELEHQDHHAAKGVTGSSR